MPRPFLLSLLFALLSWSVAADILVHPFQSQDPILGVAVASRVAESLQGVEVIGPEVAAMLVPPVRVEGGFLNPLVTLGGDLSGPAAAQLMAEAVGVRTAVTGALRASRASVELDLVISVDGAIRRVTLQAPGGGFDAVARAAAAVVALWTGADSLPPRPLDLTGAGVEAVRARALVSGGFFSEAASILAALPALDPLDASLRDDLLAALAGDPAEHNLALAALIALSALEAEQGREALLRWSSSLAAPPAAALWASLWAGNVGDEQLQAEALQALTYPYGVAARAAEYARSGAPGQARSLLTGLLSERSGAALLAAAFVAADLGDERLEDALLAALGRAAPFFTYAFERRSFLAFDRDDPLVALKSLAVATELDPSSDLYWTNLGWAWYLLGLLDRSEAASRRALELDAGQFIARYNLGLVLVATDRLSEALVAYREATRLDPAVDREAIADLVAAEELYPEQLGVVFALGYLLDRAGQRDAAAEAYERYLARAAVEPEGAGVDPTRVAEAGARVAALRSPLPPLELSGGINLQLGRRGPLVEQASPGDPLTAVFEVTTPGDALPRVLSVTLGLRRAGGEVLEPLAPKVDVDVPEGAIGFVIDSARIELPVELAPGEYLLEVRVEGGEQTLLASRALAVAGVSDPLRRLIGRGLIPTSLESNQPLISTRDLGLASATVWARLAQELQSLAPAAEEVLPVADVGRFAGMGGGEIFAISGEAEVVAFVEYLLASGAEQTTFVLADAYAQWVLDGAP